MIRKLQKKFIIINMLLVSLVLIIVFSSICYFSYQRMAAESHDVMERVVAGEPGMSPPALDIGNRPPRKEGPMLPVFSVTVDDSGKILDVSRENVIVTDALISQVTQRALTSGKTEGIMMDLKLRYLVRDTSDGFRIAFADMGRDMDTITSLIITLSLVGLGGLAGFFIISLFLAGWALKPVEKAWEQQRQFVADASHELKTPLTVILANTGILMAHREDTIGQQAKWVEYTQAEAHRMKKLVDDLLFLAKSDGSQSPMMETTINFSDAVWSCILPFESLAYERGVLIDSQITPEIVISGNEGQLKQLTVILLDNACKYAGNKGTITLTLKRLGEAIELAVNNTGIPIPAEHLDHIFERFYRSDSSRARSEGGYGLGLAIARTIVENHHGKIKVESNEKAGTTFTVSLPAK